MDKNMKAQVNYLCGLIATARASHSFRACRSIHDQLKIKSRDQHIIALNQAIKECLKETISSSLEKCNIKQNTCLFIRFLVRFIKQTSTFLECNQVIKANFRQTNILILVTSCSVYRPYEND